MNIGLFTDCYTPTKNGVVTSLVQLRHGLEARGHRVTVVTVAAPALTPPEMQVYRLPALPFNRALDLWLGLPNPRRVRQLAETARFDIIHTHTEFSLGWAGKYAARSTGIPLIHTAHTMYTAYRHYLPLGRWLPTAALAALWRRFLRGYAALICPSRKAQAYFRPWCPDLALDVIGNGVDDTRFFPQALASSEAHALREHLGLSPASRILLFVGRLAPEKRTTALVQALIPLLRAQAQVELLLVGDGPARAEVRQAARAGGVEAQVVLPGYVPWEMLPQIYALADLCVTASLSEIHPMTLIEAALCGLPLVARDDAAYADLIAPGQNGYRAATDAELAAHVAALLADAAQRRAFAQHSPRVAAQFSLTQHVTRVESLYRRVLAQQK